jgi:serine protease Do
VKPLGPLVILVVATSAALARPALSGRDPSSAASGARPHPAVVRVIVPGENSTSLGSGALVAVSDKLGLVLTNWHVVCEATGPIVVAFPDGFRSGATLIQTDRDWDLAALAIWRPNVEPIPLASEAPRPGELLTIAGYGKDSYRAVTGRCTQYVAPGQNYPFEMVELSAGARQGDSGGPIFNSRGELAGVLFGAALGRTTGSYCGRVRQFLATTTGDFQRLEASSTMLAQQPPPTVSTGSRQQASAGEYAQQLPADRYASGWGPQRSPSAIAAGSPPDASQASPDKRQTEPERPRGSMPVASIPAGTRVAADSVAPNRAQASSDSGSTSLPPQSSPQGSAVTPEPNQPLRWEDIAGSTRGEQLKTLLAAIGVLAILFHGLRLLSVREES